MLKFENPENGRYYYVSITKDLFNDLVININFGGRFNHFSRHVFCENREILERRILEITARRRVRGYFLVS
jgi:hypothetical protein